MAGPAATAYGWIVDALRHGVFSPGARLPGERELAERVGVSRSTLRQALARLADEGVVTRSAQRGWFVTRQVVGEPPSVLQSFSEMAHARGLRPTSRILHQHIRQSTIAEATRLHITPSARVLEIRRLRAMDDVPICIDASVLVAAKVEPLIDADLTDRSLYEALASDCGILVERSSYAVQAAAADSEIASLLELEPGAPVLVGDETTYAAGGTPILLGQASYRGDAYRFEADLYRPIS